MDPLHRIGRFLMKSGDDGLTLDDIYEVGRLHSADSDVHVHDSELNHGTPVIPDVHNDPVQEKSLKSSSKLGCTRIHLTQMELMQEEFSEFKPGSFAGSLSANLPPNRLWDGWKLTFESRKKKKKQSTRVYICIRWNGLEHVASDELHIAITGDGLADDMRKV
ncbi:hypothetical protein EJB05_40660 [Eragrostis curvula]|uniref:Uncharacterized protein n=1 Tax=Eragrostis curvula TaxID=38414 RepID=A0A5J9TQI0_9POAL|nr:hypothetical protein EJB05_40660 [Eragrostis curvula]